AVPKELLGTRAASRVRRGWVPKPRHGRLCRPAAPAPRAATRPPRRREEWLRILVVGCSLPCDPSGWGSFMQWRDDTTLPSGGQASRVNAPEDSFGSDPVIRRCRLDVRFGRKRTWLGDL